MKLKRMIFRAAFLLGVAVMLLLPGCGIPLGPDGTAQLSQADQQILGHDTKDINNGFFYQVWDNWEKLVPSGAGHPTFSYTNGDAGEYSLNWNNTNNTDNGKQWNFVCGKGWRPATTNRVVQYSGTFNPNKSSSGSDFQNCYLDFYGWANNNGLEYYVLESYGEYDPSKAKDSNDNPVYQKIGGIYKSNGAGYQAYFTKKTGQPTPAGTGNFDQIYSIRTSRVPPGGNVSGKIFLADHVKVWSDNGHPVSLASSDWQIMATEGYGVVGGSSKITVSEGTSGGDINTLKNSVFKGSKSTANTGDYRGHYKSNTDKTSANFVPLETVRLPDKPSVPPDPPLPVESPLSIELYFGDIIANPENGDTIDLTVIMTLAARMLGPNGAPYVQYIQVKGFKGQAKISGNTITATPVWKNAGTVSETSDETYCLQVFTATLDDNNTISFDYDFHRQLGLPSSSTSFAYSGTGKATRNGAALAASAPSRAALAASSSGNLAAVPASVTLTNLPVTAIPKIGYGSANLTVTSKWSAYSVESGQWNGVVQFQFTNPGSPAKIQVDIIVIDPENNQQVCDFRASDSNPYYWGWGGEIKFPQPHTRYCLVIRKIAPNPVSFTLRAW